jgi:hypothetical protein
MPSSSQHNDSATRSFHTRTHVHKHTHIHTHTRARVCVSSYSLTQRVTLLLQSCFHARGTRCTSPSQHTGSKTARQGRCFQTTRDSASSRTGLPCSSTSRQQHRTLFCTRLTMSLVRWGWSRLSFVNGCGWWSRDWCDSYSTKPIAVSAHHHLRRMCDV